MDIIIDNVEQLKKEIEELKQKNQLLEENLNKYTNNHRHKKYYETNKDTIKEKSKNYMEQIKGTNPEKLKEWRHTAYINRKERLKQQTT